jgi:hypothetical protein
MICYEEHNGFRGSSWTSFLFLEAVERRRRLNSKEASVGSFLRRSPTPREVTNFVGVKLFSQNAWNWVIGISPPARQDERPYVDRPLRKPAG